MTLCLHAGAEPIDYDGLRDLTVPEATPTHVPLAHHRLVDLVKATLGMYGHIIAEEHYGVMPDGSNFFGVLSLKSTYGNYTDICGCVIPTRRNSPWASRLGRARSFATTPLS
jgi:hypothetical protein